MSFLTDDFPKHSYDPVKVCCPFDADAPCHDMTPPTQSEGEYYRQQIRLLINQYGAADGNSHMRLLNELERLIK